MSPHGGRIEGGVSEIVRSFRDDYSTYLFEGLKTHDNQTLHITSTRFDEPSAVESIKQSTIMLSQFTVIKATRKILLSEEATGSGRKIGESSRTKRIFCRIGNLKTGLAGVDTENINNQAQTGLSIQLEISREQREAFLIILITAKGNSQKRRNFTGLSVR